MHTHPHSEIMDLLKQVEHPANCEGLKVVEINDEVKCTMKKPNIDDDKKMKYLATGLCKGAQPLSIAWSQLLEFEFALKQSTEKHGDPEEEATFVSINEKTFDLSEIIRYMELGLKLTSICHAQSMQKCHLDLQYLLAASTKKLALEKQLITYMMFGDDMQQAHKDLLAKKKVTAVTSTPKEKKTNNNNYMQNPAMPFLGFSWGSPRIPQWGSPQQGDSHFCPWTSNNTGFHGGHSSGHQVAFHTKQLLPTLAGNQTTAKGLHHCQPRAEKDKLLTCRCPCCKSAIKSKLGEYPPSLSYTLVVVQNISFQNGSNSQKILLK